MPSRSAETYPGQRGKEKRELFKRFRCRVIEDVYRRRFFSLFKNCCFKCGRPEKQKQEIGSPPILCIDHHVPMALGGHLVPGNLVSLCRDCNNRKLDVPPAAFYSPEELKRLEPLLEAQHSLFTFELDWDRWLDDREAYLLDLGVEPTAISAALYDEKDYRYVGPGRTGEDSGSTATTAVIRLDVDEILKNLDRPNVEARENSDRMAS
jgi:5-methylcytosine-specific restriction endonuclease McrA